ncbi:hypothetical protein D1781_12525 [Amnibacterium setariae]|uniref:Capsular biosynthesis protein n=1 Tax=Amnibacterium setariae TaxID=2306585 RepID=A0A3A1U5R4_9MICO|nr:hypothetical protein D1781_12525 [Amnibacterium setariae]
MRTVTAALMAATLLPGGALQKQVGRIAYHRRRPVVAQRAFAGALRTRPDRETWLYAASTEERLKRPDRRDADVAIANERFPAPDYDARAAFAVSTARPWERDAVARFAAEHADRLAAAALELRESARDTGRGRFAFVYWNSLDRPDVVQHCIASMRAHLPADLTLVELHDGNLADWVDIDRRILDLVDIPAHRADLIRLHLLSTWGGMWLDASCLLNPDFPAFAGTIRDEDLFLFTYRGSRTGNWFIWGTPESYRLQLLRSTLDAWFLDGRRWTNYFMFHDVVEMLYWTDPRYRAEWDAGMHLRPDRAFDCHKTLGRSVTDEEWRAVRRRSPINKLSWRKYNAPELRADPTSGIARLMAEPLPAGLVSA